MEYYYGVYFYPCTKGKVVCALLVILVKRQTKQSVKSKCPLFEKHFLLNDDVIRQRFVYVYNVFGNASDLESIENLEIHDNSVAPAQVLKRFLLMEKCC